MPIEGFDFKEFARNLAEQVGPALPPDIADADKQYIVNIVHNFCYMAGEAISNDTTINFNAEQASIVSQFIGEWAFHKAIDSIRGNIPPQLRDGILQKVAFTVFEIAKTAIIKNMPQGDMISVVEFHVKKAYNEALEELKSKGALTEEQVQEAQSHSNIDEMAQAAAQAEVEAQANGAPPSENYNNTTQNDTKILKLATFSILLKNLSEEKRNCLIKKFSPEDASMLRDYTGMDGLENRLDQELLAQCLADIKSNLPKSKSVNKKRVNQRLYNIINNSDISKISNIMMKERQYIKSFINNATQGEGEEKISPYIADVVCNFLEEKLNR